MDNQDPLSSYLEKKGVGPAPESTQDQSTQRSPASDIPLDQTQSASFDLDQYVKNKESKVIEQNEKLLQSSHGDISHGLEALRQGIAQVGTLGLSDFAYSTPEQKREAELTRGANPWWYGLGQLGGAAGLTAVTGGAAGPAEAGLLARGVAPLAARALGFGAEGAIFGAGNALSDFALSDRSLGDPKALAQKVIADVGIGAALGGGFGILSKGLEAAPALLRGTKEPVKAVPASVEAPTAASIESEPSQTAPSVTSSVESQAATPPAPPQVSPAIKEAPQATYKGITPTNLEEIRARVKNAAYNGISTNLPQKEVLEAAAANVEMNNPIHPVQVESLSSKKASDNYKLAREFDPDVQALENLQKKELTARTDQDIKSLSPEVEPTTDAQEGGRRAIEAFTDQYKKEKELITPILEELKKTPLKDMNHLPGMVDAMTTEVPKLSRMFDTSDPNVIKVKPVYNQGWGIDEATYRAVKKLVNGAKAEPPKDFEALRDFRKGLDQHIDITKRGDAQREIMALKKGLMQYMQKAIDRSTEDINIRDAFKRYAINEQERAIIERKFGASVGTPEFDSFKAKPTEKVLDKIFKDSETVKAAKRILEPKQFNELLANFLAEAKKDSINQGVFSSAKWDSFLKGHQYALNEAFSDNPGLLKHLKDMTTIMRILPDNPSINPLVTAKTLLGKIASEPTPEGVAKALIEKGKELFHHKVQEQKVNSILQGKADQAAKLGFLRNMAARTTEKINSATKAISKGEKILLKTLPAAVGFSDSKYNGRIDRIKKASSDPVAFMNYLSDKTYAMSTAAPNVTTALHASIANAVQYLKSKIPTPPESMVLSQKFEPSNTQKRTFNNYYDAVSHPLSVLHDVANGTINSQSMEALKTVHPDLLKEMQHSLMSRLKPEEAKDLPFAKKLSIAKFLESPLDENMLPSVALSNQVLHNAPIMSNQALPKQGRKTAPLGPMKNIKLASRTATRTQEEDED